MRAGQIADRRLQTAPSSAPLMHAGQIVLEEAAVYAVASAEVTGVVEEAATGVVGGFAADVDA